MLLPTPEQESYALQSRGLGRREDREGETADLFPDRQEHGKLWTAVHGAVKAPSRSSQPALLHVSQVEDYSPAQE
jgi:hypothetical protein